MQKNDRRYHKKSIGINLSTKIFCDIAELDLIKHLTNQKIESDLQLTQAFLEKLVKN